MPSDSLIPDRQITFSPDLAATIGLEESILLQGLGNRLRQREGRWHALVMSSLIAEFPFWDEARVRTLLERLAALGILTVIAGDDAGSVRVAFSQDAQAAPSPAQKISAAWQPGAQLLDLLALNHGIPRDFALSQFPEFDSSGDDHSRDSRFRQHVLSRWRRQQQQHPAFAVSEPPRFDSDWQPSQDALEIMARSGIDLEFADTLIPEFVLYWRERGGPPKEVNSRFIKFARDRWTRFKGSLEHSTEPRRITTDWAPHKDVYDILSMAGIEEEWARSLLPEFVLYWRDSNELHASWNSKFLHHVKHQWRWQQEQGQRHGGQQAGGSGSGSGRTRDRSLSDDLSDTSWAE